MGFTYILYGSVAQGARVQLKGLNHNMGHSLLITVCYRSTHCTKRCTHTHTRTRALQTHVGGKMWRSEDKF